MRLLYFHVSGSPGSPFLALVDHVWYCVLCMFWFCAWQSQYGRIMIDEWWCSFKERQQILMFQIFFYGPFGNSDLCNICTETYTLSSESSIWSKMHRWSSSSRTTHKCFEVLSSGTKTTLLGLGKHCGLGLNEYFLTAKGPSSSW